MTTQLQVKTASLQVLRNYGIMKDAAKWAKNPLGQTGYLPWKTLFIFYSKVLHWTDKVLTKDNEKFAGISKNYYYDGPEY